MTPPNPPVTTRTLRYGAHAITEGARLIRAGQPVAVTTETVYGLAADATDAAAVARIYAAKGRPSFNPLIVHVRDLAAAQEFATFDALALALAAAFWPGPLTLVLPLRAAAGGKSGIASLVTAGLDTIALRVPRHRAMQALLAATGKPLAAPSANASGGMSPTRASHVVASLGGRVALVIDDGATDAGLESTIVRGHEILRPGPITADDLHPYTFPGGGRGPVTMTSATGARPSPGKDSGKITSPGQLPSHYAPNKPLRLNATEAAADEYLIGFDRVPGTATLSPRGDLIEAAAALFDALHHADASAAPRIAVAPIPHDGIGAAINDRLARAAHTTPVSAATASPCSAFPDRSDTMTTSDPAATARLGDRTVKRLGYGAMQLAGPGAFGPPRDRDTALAVLRAAVDSGVDHIDTSDYYGPYIVNQLIREALHPYPDDLVLVTKIGARRDDKGGWLPAFSPADLTAAVHDNLRHLGVEALDVVNLRLMFGILGPAEGPIEEPLAALIGLRDAGLVRQIGLSNATPRQVADARAMTEIACVQNQYNLAHRDDDALIDSLAADGIAYVPFFPLGGFSPLQSDALTLVAERLSATPMQVALAWLLERAPNVLLIPGTSSLAHLHENLAAADLVLDADAMTALDAIGAG